MSLGAWIMLLIGIFGLWGGLAACLVVAYLKGQNPSREES